MSKPEIGVAGIREAAEGKTISLEVTGEERHQLISQAAYFRAEQRSFEPGHELEDWLEAEAEIERRMSENAVGNLVKNI
ncbi:MAG: DUF2934 domain-containing protein [Acidobacteria bacterium]|nr:DUF2934 domain-containing protein [Acidobacteriota bacterium]